MPNYELIQSLERAFDIIEIVAGSEAGARLKDVSERSGIKLSTAHNIVRTLKARGYILHDRDAGVLRLGPALPELLSKAADKGIFAAVEKAMLSLSGKFPAGTITYSEMAGGEIMVKRRISPDLPGVVQRPSSSVLEPYKSVTGLVFLSFADESAKFALECRYPFNECQTIWKTEKALSKAVAETAKKRYAHCVWNGKRFGVAVPVMIPSLANFRGALGISMPVPPASSRKSPEQMAKTMTSELDNASLAPPNLH